MKKINFILILLIAFCTLVFAQKKYSPEELKKMCNAIKTSNLHPKIGIKELNKFKNSNKIMVIPNWQSYMNPAGDQDGNDCCWAFAATGTVKAQEQYIIKGKIL